MASHPFRYQDLYCPAAFHCSRMDHSQRKNFKVSLSRGSLAFPSTCFYFNIYYDLKIFPPAHCIYVLNAHPLPNTSAKAQTVSLDQGMIEKLSLTKREKIFITALGVLMLILALLFNFTAFEMTEGWEVFFLVFIGFPLGLMIATDPERIRK
jgi:hypothetical protein